MKKSEKEQLLKRLFERKKRYELTDAELSVKLGVTSMQISRWRRGKSLPSPLAVVRIKEFLNKREI